jgi:K+-sensing histidine kinase KdpD
MSTLSTFLLELTDEFDAGPRHDLSLRVLDLEDAVETAAISVYSSASDRRQRLVIDIDERARYIRADSTKMKRVLSNLLLHASGQTPPGTVTVLARRECEDCIISVAHTAETVSLSGLTELLGVKDRVTTPEEDSTACSISLSTRRAPLDREERGAGTTIFVSFPSPEIDYSESNLSLAPG